MIAHAVSPQYVSKMCSGGNRVASPPPASPQSFRGGAADPDIVGGRVLQASPGHTQLHGSDRLNGPSSPAVPGAGRHRNNSGSSVSSIRGQRQRSYKHTQDDDKVKKSRAWANAYELSQDLHDKQLEMLERKYGGHLRARRAARIIQQAYRHYCMNRNFRKLRNEAEDRRHSRRLSEFGRSKTIWTDMVANLEEKGPLHSRFYTTDHVSTSRMCDQEFMSYADHFHHESSEVVQSSARHSASSSRTVKVIQKSHSLNLMNKESISGRDSKRPGLQRTLGLDLGTIKEGNKTAAKPPVATSGEESNNNRNSYPELNDSSGSSSPRDTPIEPTVDLPSVNFENLLESKETDILNDSFHSDSSQDANQSPRTTRPVHVVVVHQQSPPVERVLDSCVTDPLTPTVECNGDVTLQDSDSTFIMSDVQIKVEDSEMNGDYVHSDSVSDRTPTESDSDTLTRIYNNTEVRLRKKKCANLEDSSTTELQSPCEEQAQLKKSPDASPIWKRKSTQIAPGFVTDDLKRMSNISETSEQGSLDGRESHEGLSSSPSSDTCSMGSEGAPTYHKSLPYVKDSPLTQNPPMPKMSDRQRKRMYRIGLNLFNKKPEKGIKYLTENRFIENRPMAVAKFLSSRKGLSKQMIGEYLGNLQKQFNMEVLKCFAADVDLSGLQVDMALRKFQAFFRMPGEAQKIERLMEAFAERYCDGNMDQVKNFRSPDTIFLLAFAIIMLNTDLHNKNIKPDRKMKLSDFIKNLKGIDHDEDIDPDVLGGIYDRIKLCEFKSGADHVSQVVKVEQMIVGKKPVRHFSYTQLSLPHRRLVCYCRLYEVPDPNKREKLGLHQREVFLFNDMLMVTKIFSKKKNNVTYSYRHSFSLCGMLVYLFETPHYKHGIRLTTNIDGKVLFTFNARNEHDRSKFVEDLKEAIQEMNEMEAMRIEEELQKQKLPQSQRSFNRHSKDSGVVDIELLKPTDPGVNRLSAPECGALKKTTLSNSLIDLSEGTLRRGSGGSLDSGMASTGSGSQGSQEDNSNAAVAAAAVVAVKNMKPQTSSSRFGLFGKKGKSSKTALVDSSEV